MKDKAEYLSGILNAFNVSLAVAKSSSIQIKEPIHG